MLNIKKPSLNFPQIIAIFILVFSLKFFQSTPVEETFFKLQAVFLLWSILFIHFYHAKFLLGNKPINRKILFYYALIIFVPILSGWRSYLEFNQPIFYGILSERNWIALGGIIWFYYMLSTGKQTYKNLESLFIFMAWLSLIFFSLLALTYEPNSIDYSSNDPSFIVDTENRGIRFKFQMYFLTFGSIYYFLKFNITKNPIYLAFLLPFLIYIIFVFQGRTYMIFMTFTFLMYYVLNYSFIKLIGISVKVIIFLIVSIFLIQIIKPDFIDNFTTIFIQMFEVLTGQKSTDSSANARLFESQYIFNYFDLHPLSVWLGSGGISHQWRNGYESIFGYFYPVDTGLLGGVFVYGIIGTIFIMIIPMYFSIKAFAYRSSNDNIFLLTIKYLLLYYVLTFPLGSFHFRFIEAAIPLFILLGAKDAGAKLGKKNIIKSI